MATVGLKNLGVAAQAPLKTKCASEMISFLGPTGVRFGVKKQDLARGFVGYPRL